MSSEQTYNISFTAGALMVNETSAVAEVYLEQDGDWEKTEPSYSNRCYGERQDDHQ